MEKFAVLLLLGLVATAFASPYDPHVFPNSGPFYEGWYLRILDTDTDESYGMYFGTMLPAANGTAGNRAVVCLLRSNGTGPLIYNYAFPDPKDVQVSAAGQAVTLDPDATSPPNFEWSSPDGFLQVTETQSIVSFTADGITITAEIGAPLAWGANGAGPHGWLDTFNLPLNWYVFSLGSRAFYSIADANTGTEKGGNAMVYMEKTWGETFPTAMFWSHGMRKDDVSFAMTGGPVKLLGPLSGPGHLVGYRNPMKSISFDFQVGTSYLSYNKDPCNGIIRASVADFSSRVDINVGAPSSSFSECVVAAWNNGFEPHLSATYNATAEVIAYERSLFMPFKEIDRQIIPHSAIKFGGSFVCNNACKKN